VNNGLFKKNNHKDSCSYVNGRCGKILIGSIEVCLECDGVLFITYQSEQDIPDEISKSVRGIYPFVRFAEIDSLFHMEWRNPVVICMEHPLMPGNDNVLRQRGTSRWCTSSISPQAKCSVVFFQLSGMSVWKSASSF